MSRRRFSKRDLEAKLKAFGGLCAMCKCDIGGGTGLEWDHHIPLRMGGDDELSNLEPLCKRCHRLKTNGDQGRIAKTRRQEQKHLGIKETGRRKIQSAGFKPAPPQHTARRPINKWRGDQP